MSEEELKGSGGWLFRYVLRGEGKVGSVVVVEEMKERKWSAVVLALCQARYYSNQE